MLLNFFVPLLALAGSTSSLTARQTSSSTCPFNYPSQLNTTKSHNGLIFTIASNNPQTKNRAVQLRTVASSYGSSDAPLCQVAAIDCSSPVLLGQFVHGSVRSENRSDFNQLYDLGPTAGLRLVTEDASAGDNFSRWALEFSQHDTPDDQFYLLGPTDDGTYGWYHREPLDFADGFTLCEQDGGSWFQLFYDSYDVRAPPETPGCESVGVKVSIRPRSAPLLVLTVDRLLWVQLSITGNVTLEEARQLGMICSYQGRQGPNPRQHHRKCRCESVSIMVNVIFGQLEYS